MRNACLLIPCNNQQASGHKPCSNSDLNLQVSSGLAGVPAGRAPEIGNRGRDKRPDSRERPALYSVCLLILTLMAIDCHAQSIVYTRQPRLDDTFANWQRWYDGGLPDRHTESDLILDDLRGSTAVIHDCTNSPPICAAYDNRVSPDGLKIAYTLAEGNALYPVKTWGDNRLTPPIEFQAARYSLWIYDTVSKTKSKVLDNARMPDWYSNDGLVFASSRAGVYAPWAYAGREYGLSLQVYRATLSGNALTAITQISYGTYAMNPMATTAGEICFSEWNGFGLRGVSHTPANQWWIACSNLDGTNKHYVLGAHGSPTLKTRDYLPTDARISGEGSDQLKLLRPVSELKRGKFAVSSYYRSNHLGAMGIIYGWTQTTAEGCTKQSNIPESVYQSTAVGTGRFVPCDIAALTPYGNSQDTTGVGSRIDKSGRAMGKAGYPAPAVGGEYIYTHARGSAYEGTVSAYNNRAAMGGEPTAKFEIRKALVKQITDPFDPKQSIVIACPEDKWNCRDARYVAPSSVLFGQ